MWRSSFVCCRTSLFLVTGSGKADALQDVLTQRGQASTEGTLPSARVQSQNPIIYLCDPDAAAKTKIKPSL